MKNIEFVRMDDKGRVLIPAGVRKSMGLKAGDVLFVRREDKKIRLVKAENPFDVLAERAVEEYKRGRTKNIRSIAKKGAR